MVAWSSIFSNNITKNYKALYLFRWSAHKWPPVAQNCVPIRRHGHGPKTLFIRETEYTWAKFKNLVSIYFMIGLIPTFLSILYANFYVGPSVLALIPEDYEPKHWEYYRHPVSRFWARYFMRSPQEKHERNLHVLYKNKENQLLYELQMEIDNVMDEKQDYQAWYFTQPMAKYIRREKEMSDEYHENYYGRSMSSLR